MPGVSSTPAASGASGASGASSTSGGPGAPTIPGVSDASGPAPRWNGPRRVLYCISGSWTDEWYDNPSAWWQWCCVFLGWPTEQWHAFYNRWRTAPDQKRRDMMASTGLFFFDWRPLPGGSIRGSTRAAAGMIAADLAAFPPETEVTLLGHSKGGNAVKHLLAAPPDWGTGARPARAIFVDAPLDWWRETISGWMGLGVERCRFDGRTVDVPCVTVNNWLDPSGGRLRGVTNYQTLVWQDYLYPLPPHGVKGFLAERVLGDLGALPGAAAGPASVPISGTG